VAQGWLREIDEDGDVSAREWAGANRELLGVHVVFLSEQDLPDAETAARVLLGHVPMVALTRGWRGLTLLTRDGEQTIPSLPRTEEDPTGAGDVFAAAFLVRYHEMHDPVEAASFACCVASFAVEAIGSSGLPDRDQVERRRQEKGEPP
jgi:1D-myo-inositol 3-kinase